MSEASEQATWSQLMSSAEDSPVSRPAAQQPFLDDVSAWPESIAGSGERCTVLSVNFSRTQPSWKTPSQSGLPRCREIWRTLATEYPDTRSRLGELVRRIYAGACSSLPTVTARDWRSEGRQDHPRLVRSNGLPLNETLGCRFSPEFCEWMMGFPVGYTDVSGSQPAEMPLFRTAPNRSAD